MELVAALSQEGTLSPVENPTQGNTGDKGGGSKHLCRLGLIWCVELCPSPGEGTFVGTRVPPCST